MNEKKRYKRPTKRSKYFVPPAIWDNAISFCRCYPIWIAELAVCDSSRAIRYDQPKVQTSGDFDPTETLAIQRAKLREKIKIVEDAAEETAENEVMKKYLILGVAHHLSFDTLQKKGIPCGRRMYHELRREMIYRVAQEL